MFGLKKIWEEIDNNERTNTVRRKIVEFAIVRIERGEGSRGAVTYIMKVSPAAAITACL